MKRLLAALAAGLTSLAFAFPAVLSWPPANLAVTASAQDISLPTGTLPTALSSVSDFGLNSYLVTVDGTQTVYLRCDGTAATTSNATRFIAPSMFVMSLAKSVTTCSAIAGSTGSTISITLVRGD